MFYRVYVMGSRVHYGTLDLQFAEAAFDKFFCHDQILIPLLGIQSLFLISQKGTSV